MGFESSLAELGYCYNKYVEDCKKSGKKELGFLAYIVNSLKGTL